ncbi:MAG: tRNA-intron lyase [Candidatus Bathyarchaeota archaeon]|nr:MAG: tRNA-intron lyase [Candidatus Bathyarchaeota archaeon]
MAENKKTHKDPSLPEVYKITGNVSNDGVLISSKENSENLTSRGYGTLEKDTLTLNFYEALFLQSRGLLEVLKGRAGKRLNQQELLQKSNLQEKNAWVKYLIYRDLRSRGYVVREGFGLGIDFRVYERGEYGKATASYLILGVQEGKPVSVNRLVEVMKNAQSLKKKLVLAVVNRRGEIVYYTLSTLTMKRS